MKKRWIRVLIFFTFLTGCQSLDQRQKLNHSEIGSKASLSWPGIYKGMIPCEHCEGTVLLVELNENGRYSLSRNHIGKFSLTVMEEGGLSWEQSGNIVTIEDMQFLVKEKQLLLLGANGQPVLLPSGKAALLTKD
ncbi:hypothetical protein BA739_23205 [Vibrio parahaemolyticus]|uniref:copper resistance protein NlpE N-terminal domain-containing protein n=1 Tax=Vibrio parahaemolyticus TaxID=670 RepID=UPI00068F86FC|nr:copper resistance protein NlpE N-terminal domain-containing protein [Vibrio parahaemolyticus]ELU8562259.1 copper resistance protein NlpE N-terminal domain-containing protein [Vibrio parahaemolyticus]OTV96544.1 hypothetical protein BA739_23205 [Vibrio parahaemolyticus]OTV99058.1 hypothetical protein BA740_24390 [Vibrio parahaemolyticus]